MPDERSRQPKPVQHLIAEAACMHLWTAETRATAWAVTEQAAATRSRIQAERQAMRERRKRLIALSEHALQRTARLVRG